MHKKSQMAFFAALLDSVDFLKFYIVLRCTKKLEKLPVKLENFRAVHNWGADGKIQTTGAGGKSQSDYMTTEMLAKKSEIFITSLPNFMVFH